MVGESTGTSKPKVAGSSMVRVVFPAFSAVRELKILRREFYNAPA